MPWEKDQQAVNEKTKVVPITRGKRSRLRLSVSPGASSIHYLLQPSSQPIDSAARQRSHPQSPGELLQSNAKNRKEDKA